MWAAPAGRICTALYERGELNETRAQHHRQSIAVSPSALHCQLRDANGCSPQSAASSRACASSAAPTPRRRASAAQHTFARYAAFAQFPAPHPAFGLVKVQASPHYARHAGTPQCKYIVTFSMQMLQSSLSLRSTAACNSALMYNAASGVNRAFYSPMSTSPGSARTACMSSEPTTASMPVLSSAACKP